MKANHPWVKQMAKLGMLLMMGVSMSADAGSIGNAEGWSEKNQMYTLASSVSIVMQLAFSDAIKSGKIKLENSGGDHPAGEIVLHRTILVLAGDGADYLNKSEEAFRNPCKYLDLPDAYKRLSSLEHNRFANHQIGTAKMLFDCPVGLLDWQKDHIKKFRDTWNPYLDRLYVSVSLVDNVRSMDRKTLATRKIKFKGKDHE